MVAQLHRPVAHFEWRAFSFGEIKTVILDKKKKAIDKKQKEIAAAKPVSSKIPDQKEMHKLIAACNSAIPGDGSISGAEAKAILGGKGAGTIKSVEARTGAKIL